MFSSARGFTPHHPVQGFTLNELLVVIAIIAILSVVGIAAFKGVTGGARDSTRRADIDAIAKAYEIQKTSGYIALSDSQFASGKKPQDPNSQKGDYFNWLAQDGSGFKVCASLDDNPNNVCNTPATNCYCKFSSQGTLNPSSPVNQGASTNYLSGLGGSSSSSCDPNGTLLSGLVGYWKMDEASWNGTAGEVKDWAGSNHGTAAGGANTTPGKFGNAGNFDGSNDYVDAGNDASLDLNDTVTVEAWIKGNSFAAGEHNIVVGKGRLCYEGYHISVYDTLPRIYIGEAGNCAQANSPEVISAGQWYHLVGTYDKSLPSNNIKFYVNGVLKAQATQTTGADISANTLKIGRRSEGANNYFNGTIDDVRIYNRALSSQEVSNLYNSGNGCI